MTRLPLDGRARESTFARAPLLCAAALLAVACRTAPEPPATNPLPATAEASTTAMAEARADSIRRPYTEADVHFMSGMIGHHAQAIAMSRLAAANGARASILRLAERIITAQEDEIAIMQRWLGDRGKPIPEAGAAHAGMHHGAQDAPLPGMLTAAQMRELEEARGTAFDRLFLRYMIQHHRGALAMVKALFGTQGAAQDETVFKLASDIDAEQTTEVARMVGMYTELMVEPPHR